MPLELDLGYKTLPSVTDEYENTAVCSIALTNIFCSCCGKETCVSVWLVLTWNWPVWLILTWNWPVLSTC